MMEGEMLLQFVFQKRGNKIEGCEHLIEIVGDGEGAVSTCKIFVSDQNIVTAGH